MGRYLSNLLRAGARPIGRRGGPARRSPAMPVLSLERLAEPLETAPSPAAPPAAPQPAAAPPAKAEAAAVEPETRTPAPEPEPVETEPQVVPAPAAPFVPTAAAPLPKPAREAPEPAVPEPVTEVVMVPVAQPAPVTPASTAPPVEPVRSRPAAVAETPKRSSPQPRIPAPVQVETKPERAGAAIERLAGHRDLRPPQRPLEAPPRVEFITSERVVTLLPKTPPVEREHTTRRVEPALAPRALEAPREAAAPAAAASPRPAPAPKQEVKTPMAAPTLPPAARREPVAAMPVPAFASAQPPVNRREPEGGIHIQHLDIQIVNEEQPKPARHTRPAAQPQENPSRGFERHYLREVV